MDWGENEIIHVIVAILLLTFIFGYNDPNPVFAWGSYLVNFIRVMVAAAVILGVYIIAQKITAKYYGARAYFHVWWIKRFSLKPESALPRTFDLFGKKVTINHFYLGAVIGVLATIISSGVAFFPLVASMPITEITKYRAGVKYRHMLNREQARVSVAGLWSVIVLVLILTAINRDAFSLMIVMGYYFVGVHLLPFAGLDGGRIFFNSVYLYIATIVFAILAFVLSNFLGLIGTLIISLLLTGLILLIYLIKNPLG